VSCAHPPNKKEGDIACTRDSYASMGQYHVVEKWGHLEFVRTMDGGNVTVLTFAPVLTVPSSTERQKLNVLGMCTMNVYNDA
jgi:hypothetical protein